jgi:hypothetical protein
MLCIDILQNDDSVRALPVGLATDHAYVPANTTLFSVFCYPHVSADLDPLMVLCALMLQ